MKAHQTDFSTGSVYRNIWEVALPMTMAQLLNLLYNVVDRVFIGRIPGMGAIALSGVGLCFPIISFITAFANLFGAGGAPLFSMARGQGDDDEAGCIMGNSFCMLLLSGAALTVAGYVFHRPILYLLSASETTFPHARDYILIYLAGTVFVMVTLGMNPFINGQGFGRMGMMTVLLGAVVNIILDPLFIFVFHMGVRGAALATVISQFLSAAWVLWFLSGGKSTLRLTIKSMALKGKRVLHIASLGTSVFVMGMTNSLVGMVCNSTVQLYAGDLYVGVMTVINSVREIITMPVMGFTSGAAPVMSFNYGEGSSGRVKQAIRFIFVGGVGYTLLAWLLIFSFPGFFIRIFNSDPELVTACIPALRVYFFGFFMMALQFVGQNVFLALGKAKSAIFFSLFRKAVIVVPLTLLLPRLWGLGVMGVFVAEPVSNVLGGLACFTTMVITVLPELNGSSSTDEATTSRNG